MTALREGASVADSAAITPISKRNAPSFAWRESCEGWTLTSTPTLHIIQERMPPGTFELRHVHEVTQQFYYVLEGEATVQLDGSEITVSAGEGVSVAPTVAHQMRNDSSQPLEFLVISSQPPREDRVDLTESGPGPGITSADYGERDGPPACRAPG